MSKRITRAILRLRRIGALDANVIEKLFAADDERADNGWRTTESGKHYKINSKGDVVAGPPAMKGSNVNKPSSWSRGSGGWGGSGGAKSSGGASAVKAASKPKASGSKVPSKSGGFLSGWEAETKAKKDEKARSLAKEMGVKRSELPGAMREKLNSIAQRYKSYDPDYEGERKKLLEEWNDNVSNGEAAGLSHKEMSEIFHNPNVDLARKYNDKHAESSGKMGEPSRGYDPGPALPSAAARKSLKTMRKANSDMAKLCEQRAKEWPEGSEEKKLYEMFAGILAKPQPARPTEEESKAFTEPYLKNISSQLKPYAVEKYKKDLANEPQITNDLCDIADSLGTEMFGLDHRLKKASNSSDGGCRIAEKIQEGIEKKGLTYEQAVDGLSDLVRYTQACTPDNLLDHFEKTSAALAEKGYKPVKIKNTWDDYSIDNAYRGVNCVFESPTGTKFELQFHTPESFVGKEVQHPQYEEQRKPGTPKARFDELGELMYKNMSRMKRPKGVEKIKKYP